MRFIKINIVICFVLILVFDVAFASNRNYQNVSPREGVYLHTDKDIYFAGDIILFKLYRFNINQQPEGWESKAAYLTIIGEKGNLVAKRELLIKNHAHHGYIQLPDTLSSGIYWVVAWTSSMLMNNIPHFTKQLLVVNRFDSNPYAHFSKYMLLQNVPANGFNETRNNLDEPDGGSDAQFANIAPPEASQSITILNSKKTDYGLRERVVLQYDVNKVPEGIASASISVTRIESIFESTPNIISLASGNHILGLENQHKNLANKTRLLPENYGLVLSGKVVDSRNGRPKEGATVLLSSADTLVNLKYFNSLADGAFYFIIDEFYVGKKLYLTIFNETPDGKHLEIVVNDKFFSSKFNPQLFTVNQNFESFVEECKLIKRTQKAYGFQLVEDNGGENESQGFGPSYLYLGAVSTIKPADYVSIDNFVELTNEIIPVLRIQKQKYSFSTKMVGARNRSLLPREPQFFLDGIYIPNLGDLVNLSSDDIDRIDIVNHPWAIGALEFSGIVSIFSKNKEYAKLSPESGHKIVTAISSTNGYRLNFPEYETAAQNNNFPDFREVLYWYPDLEKLIANKSRIEFFTSDIKGIYVAVIEGFTKNGVPFSQKLYFNVK